MPGLVRMDDYRKIEGGYATATNNRSLGRNMGPEQDTLSDIYRNKFEMVAAQADVEYILEEGIGPYLK